MISVSAGRFLVFGGCEDDPQGGWRDFCASFDLLEEAEAWVNNHGGADEWLEIVDLASSKAVWEFHHRD